MRNRDAITLEVQRKLAELAERGELLPMPRLQKVGEGKGGVSLGEWVEYRMRRALHLERVPDYDTGFRRPSARTADAIWELLAPHLEGVIRLEQLFPRSPRPHQLTREERRAMAVVAKQAFLVVLECFVTAGRRRRTVTVNHAFDALAERWSDHHRRARENGHAFVVRDMREETAVASRRDLLRNGVRLAALWRVAAGEWSEKEGQNPLYDVRRLAYSGRQVFLKDSLELRRFEKLVGQDPNCRREHAAGLRVLFEDGMLPRREVRREICAERPYNVVSLGARSEPLLVIQEETRLLFDATAFREDYRAAERRARELRTRLIERYQVDPELTDWRPRPRTAGIRRSMPSERGKVVNWRAHEAWLRHAAAGGADGESGSGVDQSRWKEDWRGTVRALLEEYDRARWHTASFRAAYEQLTPIVGPRERALRLFGGTQSDRAYYLTIRSGFSRLINRRYQPAHFWPTFVSAKPSQWENADSLTDGESVESYRDREENAASMRARWFKARDPVTGEARTLVGADVSSSQTQILAFLLGNEELEPEVCSSEKPFKALLAEHAWRKHCDAYDSFTVKTGYADARDLRLVELVKTLWMRVLYGSRISQVVRDQRERPLTYGPGWTAKSAERFLFSLSWYPEVGQFLEACKRLARVAYEADPYRGVIFVDPFDGAEVKWNPVERDEVELSSEGQKLMVSLPGRHQGKTFTPAKANAGGDYPVDIVKLGNMVASCLVHMLDAYFSSLVMERLAARGIRTFVGIHDCWLVPEQVRANGVVKSGEEVLEEVITEASEEWFKGLGPVYERFLSYLGNDPQFGTFVRRIKAEWEKRVGEQRWPRFVPRRSS